MRKIVFIILLVILANCSSNRIQVATIHIKGSDTMLQLTEALAREFMKQNPGVSIYVEGGGTSSGVGSLIDGKVDIATASRNLRPDEAKILAEYYGTLGMYYLIAKDALSIYVNNENPIHDFTIEELKDIFTCSTGDWSELDGKEERIIPVIRTPNSGTHLYFQEHILEGLKYCDSAVVLPTTESVIEFIEENENAIGYGGIGYGEEITHARINGIEAVEQNARNDKYPITRYLHFFTSRTPQGAVKDFINWVLTPEGQAVIKQSGFIPLWEISY